MIKREKTKWHLTQVQELLNPFSSTQRRTVGIRRLIDLASVASWQGGGTRRAILGCRNIFFLSKFFLSKMQNLGLKTAIWGKFITKIEICRKFAAVGRQIATSCPACLFNPRRHSSEHLILRTIKLRCACFRYSILFTGSGGVFFSGHGVRGDQRGDAMRQAVWLVCRSITRCRAPAVDNSPGTPRRPCQSVSQSVVDRLDADTVLNNALQRS